MGDWIRARALEASDELAAFSSGSADLDLWFEKYALGNHRSGMTKVFVSTSSTEPNRVLGFYALATGGVEPSKMPTRVLKGIPKHEVPVIILARLATDQTVQGQGLGKALMVDAFRRIARITEDVGIRALLIHAKDQAARDFYLKIAEFEPSPTDPLHLILLLKDLRKTLNP